MSIAKDVLVGLSVVSAAVFAYLSLDAWRKGLKGKAEYELAKNVLKSVYRVREAFEHVRHGPHGKDEALQILRDSFISSDTRKDRKKTLVH